MLLHNLMACFGLKNLYSCALIFMCLFRAPAHRNACSHNQVPMHSIEVFIRKRNRRQAVTQPACTKMTPVHTDIFVGISQLLGYDNLIQSLTGVILVTRMHYFNSVL